MTPYLLHPGVRRVEDGQWVQLVLPDGSRMHVRARELPAFERLAHGDPP